MANILVVEDYRDSRNVVALILSDASHKVRTAPNGADGIELAVTSLPDLVLMDLAMPVVDGWEATRRLKADPRTSHIPVIAFTAQTDTEAIQQAVRAGCDAVIAKPFEIDTLLNQIETFLASRKQAA